MFRKGEAIDSESRLVVARSWACKQAWTGKEHRTFYSSGDSKTGLGREALPRMGFHQEASRTLAPVKDT